MFCKKRGLKYLAKFLIKHLRQSLCFQLSCRIETCNFIENRLRHRCFPVNFEKFLISAILWSICGRRSCLRENIYYMAFLATVYLAKNCLPCCLLNKQKECASVREVSKTVGIYKKTLPLNYRPSTHNFTRRSTVPRKTSPLPLTCYYFCICIFFPFTTKYKRKLAW